MSTIKTREPNVTADSKLDLTIKENAFALTADDKTMHLEELLAGSPKECFKLTQEDREWLAD